MKDHDLSILRNTFLKGTRSIILQFQSRKIFRSTFQRIAVGRRILRLQNSKIIGRVLVKISTYQAVHQMVEVFLGTMSWHPNLGLCKEEVKIILNFKRK